MANARNVINPVDKAKLPLNYSFSMVRLRGVTFLAKLEKSYNALGRKIQKIALIVEKNRKPKTKLEKNPQTAQHQN